MGRGNSKVIKQHFHFIFIFLMLFVLGNSSCKRAEATEVQVVSIDEMRTHLKYSNVQVIDVRSKNDFQESHILNAENIIYDKNFRNKLNDLDKTKPVAIYCTTGKISSEAAKILQQAGFQRIYVLNGGIKHWISEKQQVIKKN